MEAYTIELAPNPPITATATMSLADAASTALAKANQEERAADDAPGINELLQRKAPRLATPSRPLPPLPSLANTPSAQVKNLVDLLPTTTPTPLVTETTADQAAPNASSAAESVFGVVSVSTVNVRAGPGTVYAIAGQLQRADEFEITGRNEDGSWLQICCPVNKAEQSWISAALVELRLPVGVALQDVAIAEAPPAPAPVVAAAQAQAAPAAVGLPGAGGFSAPGATNPLTGLALPASRSGQRPIIVCVNNDFAARPQFGTAQADVMYEYVMEGYGITRFSAIYYGSESSQIGPVRSARLINYYMGALYDAGLVCSGAM